MKEDPNVRAAGASTEAATVYTTYADVEESYDARSLLTIRFVLRILPSNLLSRSSDSDMWPYSCQSFKIIQALSRCCYIREV